jgi:hypothetical protein
MLCHVYHVYRAGLTADWCRYVAVPIIPSLRTCFASNIIRSTVSCFVRREAGKVFKRLSPASRRRCTLHRRRPHKPALPVKKYCRMGVHPPDGARCGTRDARQGASRSSPRCERFQYLYTWPHGWTQYFVCRQAK